MKINKDYAKKFEHRKKREEVDNAKLKYGKNYEKIINEDENMDENSSDLEEEDEHGELINQHLSDKFLQTIAKIRLKNPEIYENEK